LICNRFNPDFVLKLNFTIAWYVVFTLVSVYDVCGEGVNNVLYDVYTCTN